MGNRESSVVLWCCGSPEMASPSRADSDGGWRRGRVKETQTTSNHVSLTKIPYNDVFEASRAGDMDILKYLLDSESGAICSEHTFDGDRCHYTALNLKVRKFLKAFEARPPPLGPLQGAPLRDTFLGSWANMNFLEQSEGQVAISDMWAIETIVFMHSKMTWWSGIINRLDIEVDDMEDLVRICKVCKCQSLQKVLEKKLIHQKYAEYKALRDVDNSQKWFILQGISLPEENRLPNALHKILQIALVNSNREQNLNLDVDGLICLVSSMQISEFEDDLADVCVRVDKMIFRCHQVVLASRYTDGLKDIDPNQTEEMFDAASRYMLFPLKRAVADALLPHLEMVSPAELCHLLGMRLDTFRKLFPDGDITYDQFDPSLSWTWLTKGNLFQSNLTWDLGKGRYGVFKILEYCLDAMACNFETFADTQEFRAMLLILTPPSGDSSLCTTTPSAPGAEMNTAEGNVLDGLREKWLEAEAAELDERDESALLFDKRLEMLMHVAEQERANGLECNASNEQELL
ncbi:hypothetical protein RND71_018498 [Anisodus tanguticus]|uniref:Uncharacterized protein n=1 Tax=Anisodus tanguticus TaxID=243964 RepID=A0AAE1S5Q7_9SOLA|nr:hypothetical protein RND71_018498 [Anisodus tanguticus]